ncbi:MAG TPA: hypothetical protein VK915_08445 [Gaiellaceae bacterium]|nr:hypothetical protein [Gaiellaceae bacterium]
MGVREKAAARPEDAASAGLADVRLEVVTKRFDDVAAVDGVTLEIDPEIAEDEHAFPSQETIGNTFIFDAEASDNPDFKEKLQAVIGV